MVLRIFKIIAISGSLSALENTKFFLADPAGGAYSAPPDPLAGLRGPTSKGEGKERERGKEEGKGRGRKGEGPLPLSQIPGSALVWGETVPQCLSIDD